MKAGGREHELADVDCGPATADALEDHVEAVALGEHGVDEGPGDVDPSAPTLS